MSHPNLHIPLSKQNARSLTNSRSLKNGVKIKAHIPSAKELKSKDYIGEVNQIFNNILYHEKSKTAAIEQPEFKTQKVFSTNLNGLFVIFLIRKRKHFSPHQMPQIYLLNKKINSQKKIVP